MKIEVNETGSRKYYNEFLYILSNYNKFLKDPKTKTKSIITLALEMITLCLFIIIMSLIIYLKDKEIIFAIILGMFIFLLVFSVIYLFVVNSRIKSYMKSKSKKIIDITEEYVGYLDDKKEIKVMWEDIAYVLVNKYSICFLPKNIESILISISSDYKDKVLNAVNEQAKKEIIIDNTKD